MLAGQVSWSRIASAQIGGSLTSAMVTLSAAMAGLGLGAFLAGRLLLRLSPRRLIRFVVPACSALLTVAPFLILQVGRLEGSSLARRGLAALLLAGAHAPFGMILPCIAGKRPGGLYSLAALGGAAGALAFVGFLTPYWGFDELAPALGVLTLLSGLPLCVRASAVRASAGAATVPPVPTSTVATAFALGALGLFVETLWLQILGFAWESNAITFALVTASTIGGVSLGSGLASRFGRDQGPATALALSALSLAGSAALSPLALHAFTFVERLGTALLLVGLPAVFFGAAFARLLARSPGSLGLILGANASGSAAGPLLLALAAPWIVWPAQAAVFVACGYGALGSAAARRPLRTVWIAPACLVFFALGGSSAIVPGPTPAAYQPGWQESTPRDFEATVMPFVRGGIESTVAITRNTRSGIDILWIDRSFQGDTSALGRRIPRALGRIPGELLGRPPRRALAIGLGTGVTLSAMADGGARSIDVAELSAGVIEANRGFLSDTNQRVLERPGIRVHHEDGRTLLMDADRPFDLVVADMIFPTSVGAGNLFSREFYALVRRKLAADGVFVHWVPCFLLAPEDLRATVAAFLEAFPEGSAWIGYMEPRRLILGLAGGAIAQARSTSTSGRFALGPSPLRAFAAGEAPLRDADPRMEIRSNRTAPPGEFGRQNLEALVERMRASPVLPGAEVARDAWLLTADAGLAAMGGAESSLASYGEAARRSPDVDDANFILQGLLFERQLRLARRSAIQGDEEQAVRLLRRAASNPLEAGGNLDLSEALAAAGLVKEALAQCEEAARKNPRSADATIKLAWLACAAGDHEKALQAYQAALHLRPDLPPFYEEVARRLGRTIRP